MFLSRNAFIVYELTNGLVTFFRDGVVAQRPLLTGHAQGQGSGHWSACFTTAGIETNTLDESGLAFCAYLYR